jgi:hypothetical protein
VSSSESRCEKETRTPPAFRPPDPKVAEAAHEVGATCRFVSLGVAACPRVSSCRKQDVSKRLSADSIDQAC